MKKIILFSIGFAIVATSIFYSVNSKKGYYTAQNYYNSKQLNTMKGLEMLYKMKANQTTGLINMADVIAAKNQLNSSKLYKAGFPLVWTESGPDNIGGRCRTILVDRNNPNTLYAASVSGGIFKSTNAGGSWSTINDALSTLAFQSSCQTIDGTVYFGSGENAGSFGGSGDNEGSVFPGDGIYKSTDGITVTQLESTNNTQFMQVNSMASAPDKDVAYAGTNSGLKFTDNGGTTWTNLVTGSCRDVKVATNGTVLAYIGGKIWRSTTGTTAGSYTAATGVTGGFNRIVIGISPQDPNYVYLLASQSNNFGGLFQSTDGGISFKLIVPGGSTIFNPLNQGAGGQGDYDLTIAVHPRDKKKVFMGGVIMAEWTEAKGPYEVFNGTHSDQHWITYDTISSPMRMYVGNDGGVYRSRTGAFNIFDNYNIGFNVTQFYGIASSIQGDIIGGTQDNGTLHINKVGTEKKRAQAIYGGDGFRCEISERNPNYFLGESYYGNIGRSFNKGSGVSSILDRRVPRYKLGPTGAIELDPKGSYINAPFNTGIKLAERDSTLSRLFVGATECLWMVEHVFSLSKSPTWFKVSNITNAFVIETSASGKYIFAGKNGQIVRIKVPMIEFDTLKNLDPKDIYPGCTTNNITGNLPSGRFITGIAIDKNDTNRLIVTLGNYGNTNYIYYTENALDAVPTWINIQGNLPSMPVYDAEFIHDNSNTVVIGTEFGVFGTTNVKAGTVSWTAQNTGTAANKPFPRVATYELRQVSKEPSTGSIIVAGTHGRGIFETHTMYASIKNPDGTISAKLNIYPNPATDFATIQYSIGEKDHLTLTVMDMTGKVVYQKNVGSETPGLKKLRIETNMLPTGTYIVQIAGTKHKGAAKMIVQK
ncbi:MAG: T9SS type A sorting domain-containing protein [Bacteroidia bacterium]